MPNLDGMANGDVDESSAESHDAEQQQAVPKRSSAGAVGTKGRGLRRWRRIRRDQLRRVGYAGAAAGAGGGSGTSGDGGGRDDEDSTQLHKRRLPLPANAPKAKHEAGPVEDESSTASVESCFVPRPPVKLAPELGFRIGFSIGADSDHSDDRSRRSSTAASALRVFARHGHDALPRDRDRPRSHTPGASLRGKQRSRADKPSVHAEAEDSRSSVESHLHSSNASKARQLGVGVTGNSVLHKGNSTSDDPSDVGRSSEDVRSTAAGGHYQQNGTPSVVGSLARRGSGSDDDVDGTLEEGSALNGQNNGGLHSGADPYGESVLWLRITQEALENEILKIAAVGKAPSDEFDTYDDEGSGAVHLEEPAEEVSETIKHLESRLEEASALIKDKDSRILDLGSLGRMRPGETTLESTNLPLWQFELDGLYQEKMEADIRCIILTRAYQTLATLADDQMALYEAHKFLSEEYKQLGLRLRQAENRAVMLEEKAEKLQVQCQELSGSSDLLQLRSKASRVSLFCFVQFILLCIAIGTYLIQLVPSSTEVVPT